MQRRVEPQAAYLRGFWVKMWLILCFLKFLCEFVSIFANPETPKYIEALGVCAYFSVKVIYLIYIYGSNWS